MHALRSVCATRATLRGHVCARVRPRDEPLVAQVPRIRRPRGAEEQRPPDERREPDERAAAHEGADEQEGGQPGRREGPRKGQDPRAKTRQSERHRRAGASVPIGACPARHQRVKGMLHVTYTSANT